MIKLKKTVKGQKAKLKEDIDKAKEVENVFSLLDEQLLEHILECIQEGSGEGHEIAEYWPSSCF